MCMHIISCISYHFSIYEYIISNTIWHHRSDLMGRASTTQRKTASSASSTITSGVRLSTLKYEPLIC